MTAIPPHLQKAIDEGRARIVDKPAKASARPSRATAAEDGGQYRCCACGAVFNHDTSDAANAADIAAQPHVNQTHGGGRYELVLEGRP